MADDLLLQRARRLWAGLAGAPVVFRDAAVEVVVSPQSSLCPPGWVGIVALGGAVIVTAPDGDAAETVRRALADLPTMAELHDTLPADETLGRRPRPTATRRFPPRRHRRARDDPRGQRRPQDPDRPCTG
ncbi:hypothetical protein ACPPVO_32745 [Dactylosporangium sp. McL0621]|uniref:hypothetical protein n=1 Tax=Dactylosporangium sp. McL0621 TaxID=3415678 RepID=UPI003CFAEFE1